MRGVNPSRWRSPPWWTPDVHARRVRVGSRVPERQQPMTQPARFELRVDRDRPGSDSNSRLPRFTHMRHTCHTRWIVVDGRRALPSRGHSSARLDRAEGRRASGTRIEEFDVAEMWTAILVAPALMVVALALHHLEVTLDRHNRSPGASAGAPRRSVDPTALTGRPSVPPSARRSPRAAPTLP